METKEIKITPPEGYEIDKENSTLECIKFKQIKQTSWRKNESNLINGYYITSNSNILPISLADNKTENHNLFATIKQAKSALAMAQISQIMANDERFGGVVTYEELADENLDKYTIDRKSNKIGTSLYNRAYSFLAFHTPKQRDLFLQENEDLVRDYLMLD